MDACDKSSTIAAGWVDKCESFGFYHSSRSFVKWSNGLKVIDFQNLFSIGYIKKKIISLNMVVEVAGTVVEMAAGVVAAVAAVAAAQGTVGTVSTASTAGLVAENIAEDTAGWDTDSQGMVEPVFSFS